MARYDGQYPSQPSSECDSGLLSDLCERCSSVRSRRRCRRGRSSLCGRSPLLLLLLLRLCGMPSSCPRGGGGSSSVGSGGGRQRLRCRLLLQLCIFLSFLAGRARSSSTCNDDLVYLKFRKGDFTVDNFANQNANGDSHVARFRNASTLANGKEIDLVLTSPDGEISQCSGNNCDMSINSYNVLNLKVAASPDVADYWKVRDLTMVRARVLTRCTAHTVFEFVSDRLYAQHGRIAPSAEPLSPTLPHLPSSPCCTLPRPA